MVSFKTQEGVERAFKTAVTLDSTTEVQAILKNKDEIIKNFDFEKIELIKDYINERKIANVITIITLLYPTSLKEAVDKFYESLKKMENKFGRGKEFVKYLKTDTKDIPFENASLLLKASYLKEALKALECEIL